MTKSNSFVSLYLLTEDLEIFKATFLYSPIQLTLNVTLHFQRFSCNAIINEFTVTSTVLLGPHSGEWQAVFSDVKVSEILAFQFPDVPYKIRSGVISGFVNTEVELLHTIILSNDCYH